VFFGCLDHVRPRYLHGLKSTWSSQMIAPWWARRSEQRSGMRHGTGCQRVTSSIVIQSAEGWRMTLVDLWTWWTSGATTDTSCQGKGVASCLFFVGLWLRQPLSIILQLFADLHSHTICLHFFHFLTCFFQKCNGQYWTPPLRFFKKINEIP